MGTDREAAATLPRKRCKNFCPPTWTGPWRDWHRGHECHLDPTPVDQHQADPARVQSSAVRPECGSATLKSLGEAAGDALRQRLLANAQYCRTVAPLYARQGKLTDAERWQMFAEDFEAAAAFLSPQPEAEIVRMPADPDPNCPRCHGTGEESNAQFRCSCRWRFKGESAHRAPSETPAMESIPEFVEDRFFVEPTVYGYGVFYRDESTQKKLGVGCAQNVDEAVAKIVARSLNGVVYDAVTGGDPRPAERATGGEK